MIFFDIDNTLLDHHKSEALAIIRLCNDFQIDTINSRSLLVSFWREISKEFYNFYPSGKVSFQEQRQKRLRNFFSNFIPIDPITNCKLDVVGMHNEEISEKFSSYLQYCEESWCIFDDVLPLLESIKNERLGIITNGQTEQQLKKLEAVNILKYFDVIVTSPSCNAQ